MRLLQHRKWKLSAVLATVILAATLYAPPPKSIAVRPIIKDRTSALKIGHAILSCHYPIVAKPEGAEARESEGVWKIRFTNKLRALGGQYDIHLRASDGAVVKMIGYK